MHRLNSVQPSVESRSRSVLVDGSGRVHHGRYVYEISLAWKPWCLINRAKHTLKIVYTDKDDANANSHDR